jgi:hypothetical protein
MVYKRNDIGISNVPDGSSNLCTYCVPSHSWTAIKSFKPQITLLQTVHWIAGTLVHPLEISSDYYCTRQSHFIICATVRLSWRDWTRTHEQLVLVQVTFSRQYVYKRQVPLRPMIQQVIATFSSGRPYIVCRIISPLGLFLRTSRDGNVVRNTRNPANVI